MAPPRRPTTTPPTSRPRPSPNSSATPAILTSAKDARQNLTQYQSDALKRQITVVYPDQTSTATNYDSLGRVTSKTDQAGKVTGYGYDKLGRLTSVTDALNQITKDGYDDVGKRVSQREPNNHTPPYPNHQSHNKIAAPPPARHSA